MTRIISMFAGFMLVIFGKGMIDGTWATRYSWLGYALILYGALTAIPNFILLWREQKQIKEALVSPSNKDKE